MRQAGAEAAKRAGDAKALKAKGGSSDMTSTASPSEIKPGSSTTGGTKGSKDEDGDGDATDVKGAVTKATKPASEKAATGDVADDEDEDEDETGGEDPDADAVVAGSKDTIAINEGTGAASRDPDAEAVVPGSKDTIDVDENTSKTEESKPDDEDEDENANNTQTIPPDAQNTKTTAPTTAKGIQPTPDTQNDDSEEEEEESKDQTPPTTKTNATAATDEAESLPGKRTQAQAAAEAEEAGTSVGD